MTDLGSKCRLNNLPALQPWARQLASLRLRFLSCLVGIIAEHLTPRVRVRIKANDACGHVWYIICVH